MKPGNCCPFKSSLQRWFFSGFWWTFEQVLLTFLVIFRVSLDHLCPLNHRFNIKLSWFHVLVKSFNYKYARSSLLFSLKLLKGEDQPPLCFLLSSVSLLTDIFQPWWRQWALERWVLGNIGFVSCPQRTGALVLVVSVQSSILLLGYFSRFFEEKP